MKYKLIVQNTLFRENEIINEFNRITEREIESDTCKEKDGVLFFITNEEIIETINVLGDPYYKVLNENNEIVFKHNCDSNHNLNQ